MSGRLSIIGTPIGNLEDITLHALRLLREVDILLCEDTRVTKKLLFHYEITEKSLWAYAEESHQRMIPKIIQALQSGSHIGIVSDAGMPGISDPGSYLLAQVAVLSPDTVIDCAPGPTAVATAVAMSGLDTTNGFDFVGFIPHKKGRETLFHNITHTVIDSGRVVVAYESCHRIEKTLEWFREHCPSIRITICRELTKMFQEIYSNTPAEILLVMQSDPNKLKGEFVVLYSKP